MSKDGFYDYLGVMVDMAGCPNRCRHCWLGGQRNGTMSVDDFEQIAAAFKDWRDENGQGFKSLGFFSWWREPDYRDDYRELWQLEQALSSPGRAQRFELLSAWRLARDASYAEWAATLAPKACQITFFGMEENTDWGTRRKGAFQDHLRATERCLSAGIAPRWQLFVTKRNQPAELEAFYRLIYDLRLHERCEAIGRTFEVFIGGISPEGSGYEIEDVRMEEDDLSRVPADLISLCSGGLSSLGKPEYAWLDALSHRTDAPQITPPVPCVTITADYEVYPNIAEPTAWWRLGHLKNDGVDKVIKAYRDEIAPGMAANRNIPIAALAQQFGEATSKKLYTEDDLICRFMHQWGIAGGGGQERKNR